MLPAYAELQCRSNFSFLTGASHPAELIDRAADLGYAALALTDECSLAGIVRAHQRARERGFPLIVGAQMRLSTAPSASSTGPRLVLLCTSLRGYQNLSRWITVARRRAAKGHYLAYPSDLEGHVPHAAYLAGLPGCLALLSLGEGSAYDDALAHARWLQAWFGDRAALALTLRCSSHDDEWVDLAKRIAQCTGLPVAAAGDVLMHCRSRKPLQDVLTATRLGQPLAACGAALEPNAEAHLRMRARLAQLYPPAWLAETVRIAQACSGFSLAELQYQYPQELVPAGHTPTSWLRALTERGAAQRYPQGLPPSVRADIEKELALIAQCRYEPFFLTVADIVQWARDQGILCQGRGSAANSTVCYCLHVTEIDPTRVGTLFERFVSVERAQRNEPPDIDVDFEHQRREEVIAYIYRKYGRHRAAMTAVVIRYRARSALRDVGRALGFDIDRIDAVSHSQHWFDGGRIAPERLRENGFDPASPLCRLWSELTEALIGFPRHLSQHPGGLVIASEDLASLVPVENAAMDGRTVIQWDKDDLDAMRLIKVDVLALGMLSAIRRALAFIAAKLGRPWALQDIPAEDAATYDMLCAADSIGVFQVESRAQMSMLPRLKPRKFYDLVIQVAIVRPGPIQGGMVHPYLKRRAGLEPVVYPSAEIEKALERTLGVPIFQEQVMQIAILAADFTPGEADSLRRSMAAWKSHGDLEPYHRRLVDRMVAKGYAPDYAEAIFRQMKGFGEYGFPESHAASFALLVYASAWIKCHHPDAFLAALLNSQPMGFYAPAQLVRDARAHGVDVRPVTIEGSDVGCTLEPGGAVRLGFDRIAGLSATAARRIVQARAAAPYASAEDLARRASLDAQALQQLAQSGALAALAGHRHAAVWSVAGIDTRASALLQPTRTDEGAAPQLPVPGRGADMLADYATLGLSLTTHPLALLRAELSRCRVLPAAVLHDLPSGRLARASGLVTHRQRPGTAKGVIFVTLEDDTGSVNVIVWPQVAEQQRRPLLAARLLTVYGIWQREGEVRHLIARKLVDHTPLLQGLASRSRDFR